MEGAGSVPCPEACRQDKYQLKDGYMILVNNQFLALSPTTKYSIVPAKGGARCCDLYLAEPEHIASYQHVLLKKKCFPVPAFAYPVRRRLIKKGPEPYEEDRDMKELRLCADETMDPQNDRSRPHTGSLGTTRTGWTHADFSRLPSMRPRTWFSCEALFQYYQ